MMMQTVAVMIMMNDCDGENTHRDYLTHSSLPTILCSEKVTLCVLGNEILYNLLAYRNYRLRVVMRAWDGPTAYAEYSTFSIASSSNNYALNIGGYNGTAGNLSYITYSLVS